MIEKMPPAPAPVSATAPPPNPKSSEETTGAEIVKMKPKKKVPVTTVFPVFQQKSEFWNFTKQRIYIDEGTQTDVRWLAYKDFIEQGLLPMMKQFGYHINAKPIEIVYNLCKMTYAMSNNQFQVVRFKFDTISTEEDLDYFEFQVDTLVWERFWKQWSCLYDFSNDCDFGPKARNHMPYFIWSFVNIQLSSATAQLDDELSDTELEQIDFELSKSKKENITDDNYYTSQSKFYN